MCGIIFAHLINTVDPQTQELRTPSIINKKKNTPRHDIINLLKTRLSSLSSFLLTGEYLQSRDRKKKDTLNTREQR